MRVVFQQELAEIEQGLVDIAGLVRESVERATKAFETSDVNLAESVMADDEKIDARANQLDELAIEMLARQAPVARDLRVVVAALRISASLERMGDLAAHIAQLARLRFPEQVGPANLREALIEMGRHDVAIAGKLVDLIKSQDEATVAEIKAADDAIDALHKSIFDGLLAADLQAEAVQVVDATLASRYHERFADHAVSIAKKIQYLTSGAWTTDEAEQQA
ncbi:Phosphate-specific transport system accessory protein PhoU [Pseudoclavibacter triregionum]|nr:Phosphate-specific transport system accessory protein PhoU [Pseudoclavibacter triregionum]